jgi:hypothetical protein
VKLAPFALWMALVAARGDKVALDFSKEKLPDG